VRDAGEGLAVIGLTIMNEEVTACLSKAIGAEKGVPSEPVKLSDWTPLKTSEVVPDGPLHCERLGIGPGTNRNQVDQINTPSSPHGSF
jgi:hypothetical protein